MKIKLLITTLVLLFTSCVDVFEKDISNDEIILIAPSDNLITDDIAHTFWWEELSDALEYNLQVVSPSFEHASQLILDTIISDNQFEYTLFPGVFQWRVAGLNSTSQTEYSTYSIEVDSSLNLNGQLVLLSSPIDNYATNQLEQSFTWESLYSAEYYDFRIHYSTEQGELAYALYGVDNTELTYTFNEDAVYYWELRAGSDLTNTMTDYTSRKLIIDTQVPELPLQELPEDNSTIQQAEDGMYEFSWQSELIDMETSETLDYLYLSQDSSFSESPYIIDQGVEYLQVALDTGLYYWRLQIIDLAGNQSDFSQTRSFTISE